MGSSTVQFNGLWPYLRWADGSACPGSSVSAGARSLGWGSEIDVGTFHLTPHQGLPLRRENPQCT